MSQSDAVALQEKIDNLTFEKRVVESEKEKLSDGLAKQIQNNRSLEERCQKLEKDKEVRLLIKFLSFLIHLTLQKESQEKMPGGRGHDSTH